MLSKKIIKLALFLFGIYIAIIFYLSFSLFTNFKKQDFNKLNSQAKLLNSLTFYSDKIHIFPFFELNKLADLSLDFIEVYEGISAIFQKNNSDINPNWQQNKVTITKALNDLDSFQTDFSKPALLIFNKITKDKIDFTILSQNKEKILELINVSDILLGLNSPQKYSFILQNNMELRPTGGFMGSYAQMTVDKARITKIKVEDIYVPDGQLIGHVNPPEPIQQAFQTGFWKLRDANWSPDFPVSAKNILWFFRKGKEDPGSNLIAINLSLAEQFLEIIGPVFLPDYNQEINSTNLYAIAQSEAETDFFPGSTQKKDFLNSLFNMILLKLNNLSPDQILAIINIITNGLEEKSIQLYSEDQNLQQIFTKNKWSGEIIYQSQESDYQFIVESNLGANKANCCTSKNVSQKVTDQENYFDINLTIDLKNESLFANPKPPKHWGGDYKNYFRIYLPQKAQVKTILINNEELEDNLVTKNFLEEKNLSEYGFFVFVPHKSDTIINIDYQFPKTNKNLSYNLIIQKQSGITPFYQQVELISGENSKEIKRLVEKDTSLLFN